MSAGNAQGWGERPRRRIEVNRILGEDGSSHVLVQDLAFGEGVGWFAQKSIRLDDEQVEALLKALCCARNPGRCQKFDQLVQPEILVDGRPLALATGPTASPCASAGPAGVGTVIDFRTRKRIDPPRTAADDGPLE